MVAPTPARDLVGSQRSEHEGLGAVEEAIQLHGQVPTAFANTMRKIASEDIVSYPQGRRRQERVPVNRVDHVGEGAGLLRLQPNEGAQQQGAGVVRRRRQRQEAIVAVGKGRKGLQKEVGAAGLELLVNAEKRYREGVGRERVETLERKVVAQGGLDVVDFSRRLEDLQRALRVGHGRLEGSHLGEVPFEHRLEDGVVFGSVASHLHHDARDARPTFSAPIRPVVPPKRQQPRRARGLRARSSVGAQLLDQELGRRDPLLEVGGERAAVSLAVLLLALHDRHKRALRDLDEHLLRLGQVVVAGGVVRPEQPAGVEQEDPAPHAELPVIRKVDPLLHRTKHEVRRHRRDVFVSDLQQLLAGLALVLHGPTHGILGGDPEKVPVLANGRERLLNAATGGTRDDHARHAPHALVSLASQLLQALLKVSRAGQGLAPGLVQQLDLQLLLLAHALGHAFGDLDEVVVEAAVEALLEDLHVDVGRHRHQPHRYAINAADERLPLGVLRFDQLRQEELSVPLLQHLRLGLEDRGKVVVVLHTRLPDVKGRDEALSPAAQNARGILRGNLGKVIRSRCLRGVAARELLEAAGNSGGSGGSLGHAEQDEVHLGHGVEHAGQHRLEDAEGLLLGL
eukprot:scaffold318_cov269-Pinguiococcus_pyrenoidosus.AAC.6